MNFEMSMKTALILVITIVAGYGHVFAQVPTQTEISVSKQSEQSRAGYFFYAKPFEVTMTVNLWGEIPQQGVYVVPTNTDIIQLLSYAGGPKEKSNLEEVLIYRASPKKDQRSRILQKVNVQDILEGRSATVPLAPGDMIVVKKMSDSLTWQEWLTIISTSTSVAILGISIYTLTKK